jgi:hypothetical protein
VNTGQRIVSSVTLAWMLRQRNKRCNCRSEQVYRKVHKESHICLRGRGNLGGSEVHPEFSPKHIVLRSHDWAEKFNNVTSYEDINIYHLIIIILNKDINATCKVLVS